MSSDDNSGIGGILGRALLFPFRAIGYIFNPRNWLNDSVTVRNDIASEFAWIKKGRKHLCVSGLEYSNFTGNMSIKFTISTGCIEAYFAPHHAGKADKIKVKQETIDAFHKEHSNIKFYPKDRIAVVEIDTKAICRRLDDNRNGAVREIYEEVYTGMKDVVELTDAFKLHQDGKLVGSMADALFTYTQMKSVDENSIVVRTGHFSEGLCIYFVVKGLVV